MPMQPFRSITDARIDFVQREERVAAFARVARAWGGALLRPVTTANGFVDDPDANDVAVGLYARLRCSRHDELTGLLVFRERPMQALLPPITAATARPERLFLIEALTVSDSMTEWQPPIPALLAATAASLIATVHHDPDFRTHVAMRVPFGDVHAEAAAVMIGARALTGCLKSTGRLVAGVPEGELRFLNRDASAKATALVLAHMDGGVAPSQPAAARASGRTWHRQLTVKFPRAMRHLAEEMRLVATGSVDVGWRTPIVALNDTDWIDVADAAGS